MLAHGVGHRVPGLNVKHHVAHHCRQRLVLALLGQNVQRLHQWQTGVDHRGELTRKDHDIAHTDTATRLLGTHLLFIDFDNGQPLPT